MQACWDRIKSADIRLSSPVLATLQDLSVVNDAAGQAKKIQNTDNGIATQVAVLNVPGSQWGLMRAWANEKKLLTPKQSDLLHLASQIPLKLPTEKQCPQIWQLYEMLLDEGYVK